MERKEGPNRACKLLEGRDQRPIVLTVTLQILPMRLKPAKSPKKVAP